MRGQAIRVTCLIGLICALGAGSASATPGSQTFQQTHPFASALCERVATGHASKKLESNSAAVAQACSELMSSYATAQSAVTTAYTTFQQSRQEAIDARHAVCSLRHNGVACHNAIGNYQATIVQLHATYSAALGQFNSSVEGARLSFWQTISALRHS